MQQQPHWAVITAILIAVFLFHRGCRFLSLRSQID